MEPAEKLDRQFNSKADFASKLENSLPDNFSELDSLDQLDHVMKSVNELVNAPGDWLLVNADLTLNELLLHAEPSQSAS